MGMDEFFQRISIVFEQPLPEESVKSLFQYLTQNIEGFRVEYSLERKGRYRIEDANLVHEERPTSFGGMMIAVSNDIRITAFNCPQEPLEGPRNSDRDDLFYGFRFLNTPGYNPEELPEITLMDEVRRKTQEFFKSRKE